MQVKIWMDFGRRIKPLQTIVTLHFKTRMVTFRRDFMKMSTPPIVHVFPVIIKINRINNFKDFIEFTFMHTQILFFIFFLFEKEYLVQRRKVLGEI